jgi:hypothetical protein
MKPTASALSTQLLLNDIFTLSIILTSFISLYILNNYGKKILWNLYFSRPHDITNNQPKYHASLIPDSVTKYDDLLQDILNKAHHRNVLRMMQ